MKWCELYDGFLEALKQQYSGTTSKEYARPLKQLACFVEKEKNFDVICQEDMKPITSGTISDFLEYAKEDGKSRSYQNATINAFKKLSPYLKSIGLPDFEITEKMKNTFRSTHIVLFKKETIRDVIACAKSPKDALAVSLCYEGCVKATWLKNLQVKHYDPSNHALRICDNYGDVVKVLVYPNQLSEMTIKLLEVSIRELCDYVDEVNANRRAARKEATRTADYLYQSRTSKVPTTQAIINAISRAVSDYLERMQPENQEVFKNFQVQNLIASKRAHSLLKYGGNIDQAMLENSDTNRAYYKRLVNIVGLMY
ncbi:hypothetical protein [Pseudoramibacter sp.]|jgi:site-specific recombinase XerD|uniref:hypothetical protein n=1 Tax=Pseudoramibacter sp. TaxID=2034862 RepID=UPI0025FE7D35|nr:hypothetical protein [Pseudoramibacter sp.]MCH4073194.1 hypothetical protein [Pseudoramibacter sp.]MCH4106966.1 hypothetical protein [Pseudoramibacter sp.]